MSNDDYKLENVKAWQEFSDRYIHPGEEGWKADNPHWGIWSISEPER